MSRVARMTVALETLPVGLDLAAQYPRIASLGYRK